jgi:hypothetical protein
VEVLHPDLIKEATKHMATGDPCKYCGKPVTAKTGKLCEKCHNYPEQRTDKTIELFKKFTLPRRKRDDSTA